MGDVAHVAREMVVFRPTGVQLKAKAEEGRYEGYFSVFDVVDLGDDVIHSGAFARTLQRRGAKIKAFFAHDWAKIIGPNPVCREDEFGLWVEGRCTMDGFWGHEAWVLMRDGALAEGSIGYVPVRWEYERAEGKDWPIRHLYDVDLYEVSPVPLGMNPATAIHAVKSALGMIGDPARKMVGEAVLLDTLTGLLGALTSGGAVKALSGEARDGVVGQIKGLLDLVQEAPTEEVLTAEAEPLIEDVAPEPVIERVTGEALGVLRTRANSLALALKRIE